MPASKTVKTIAKRPQLADKGIASVQTMLRQQRLDTLLEARDERRSNSPMSRDARDIVLWMRKVMDKLCEDSIEDREKAIPMNKSDEDGQLKDTWIFM